MPIFCHRFYSSIVNTGNIAGFAYSYNLFVFRSPCYLIAYSIIKIEPGFLADLDDRGCFTKKNQRMLDNSIAEMNLGYNKNAIKKYIF